MTQINLDERTQRFVRSLTDEQLQDAYDVIPFEPEFYDYTALENAIIAEKRRRGREVLNITLQLGDVDAFYAALHKEIAEARQTIITNTDDSAYVNAFFTQFYDGLSRSRLINGWSHELETELKSLIKKIFTALKDTYANRK